MNIQELKQKVKDGFSPYKDNFYLKNIDKIFAEYDQSNKSEELPKETKEFINIWKEIEGMKKEIKKQDYEQSLCNSYLAKPHC